MAIILTDNPAAYHTKANVVSMSPSAKYVWKEQVIILVKWPATSRMGAAGLMLKCGQTLAERHLLECVLDLAGMLSQAPSGCEELAKGD